MGPFFITRPEGGCPKSARGPGGWGLRKNGAKIGSPNPEPGFQLTEAAAGGETQVEACKSRAWPFVRCACARGPLLMRPLAVNGRASANGGGLETEPPDHTPEIDGSLLEWAVSVHSIRACLGI